jgi:hypothetical protein
MEGMRRVTDLASLDIETLLSVQVKNHGFYVNNNITIPEPVKLTG